MPRLRAALLRVVPGEPGRVSAMPGAVLSGSIRDEVKSGFPAGVESQKKADATGREFRLRRSDIGQPQAQRNALGNLQPLARRGGAKGGGTMGRPGGGNVGTAGTNAAQAGQGMRPDRSPAGLTGI